MTRSKSFEDIYARLMGSSGAKNDSELSRILNITPQSINGARKRGEVPPSWIQSYAETSGVSSDWLFFGRGPKRLGGPAPTSQDSTPVPDTAPDVPVAAQESTCARCTKLEARLDEVERERRELTMENRHLWKENGELREKCARLEERQFQRSIERGDTESVGNAG